MINNSDAERTKLNTQTGPFFFFDRCLRVSKFESRGEVIWTISLTLGLAAVLAGGAEAGCVENTSTTYTCTGALEDIRANASDSFPPDTAEKITVENLTQDMPQGIFYVTKNKNDQPIELVLDAESFSVRSEGNLRAIELFTSGFAGADRSDDTSGTKTGGTSARGGSATLNFSGTAINTESTNVPTIVVSSVSGRGGNGADMSVLLTSGGKGGISDAGGTVVVNIDAVSAIESNGGQGLVAASTGNTGGSGGFSECCNGGDGGIGGAGGTVTVVANDKLSIKTSGSSNSAGLVAYSLGGTGGTGGTGKIAGDGGAGGEGGAGNNVHVAGSFTVETEGTNSDAIVATSIGGAGGTGGDGGWFSGGAPGGNAGLAGSVSVNADGGNTITTLESDSNGIVAQSIGGRGGTGGSSVGIAAVEFSASGGSAGAGDTVTVTVASSGTFELITKGDQSSGVVAQSIGGAGGNGGSEFDAFYGKAESGSYGGKGGVVTVSQGDGSTITTQGNDASGIVAQSIGGTGGSGGTSGGLVALGGNAEKGGDGNTVTVKNAGTIETGTNAGDTPVENATCGQGCSYGILAQSIGGGGGNGGSSGGWFSVGGAAAGGGTGSTVTVTNSGDVTTHLIDSPALLVQSIGGGGGHGGGAVSLGAVASASIGGNGGNGGNGGSVTVNNANIEASDISTAKDRSQGILAQSIGGGGGQGGFSASGAFAVDAPSIDLSIGGNGGTGGQGGNVKVYANGSVATEGDDSAAVMAQSIGGGGGHGGFSVSVSGSDTGAVSLAIGGSGSGGGDAGSVFAQNEAKVQTSGDRSPGVSAQSLGGGGGNGGLAVAVDANSDSIGVGFSLGSPGGKGGDASGGQITNTQSVSTTGDDSPGLIVQSIGGGGGHGGLAVTGSITVGEGSQIGASVGGSGGSGGSSSGSQNSVTSLSSVSTSGDRSTGITVQSIGGGGGHGGNSISAALATGESKDLTAAIGGSGGIAGDAGAVGVVVADEVTTTGDQAGGILLQSIGGGGGQGGTAITGTLTLSESTTIGVALGGSGGAAGSGGSISDASITANVTTSGLQSDGITAQSVGGGGGNGGYAVSGSISTSKSTNIGVTLGGGGQSGNVGGAVNLTVGGDITASGAGSRGVILQSIGGGGGTGGMAVTGNFTTSSDTKALNVAIGGSGGTGSAASAVTLVNSGQIEVGGGALSASRSGEHGIMAQSIGGGGGAGGLAANATANTENKGTQSLNVAVGGSGGTGAKSGKVSVTHTGKIATSNAASHGILAQSIAGGGGDGGATTTFSATPSTSDETNKSFSVSVGGEGGGGAAAGDVAIAMGGEIATQGLGSKGIVAQSIGGGGGTGGGNVFKSFQDGQTSDKTTNTITVGIGGGGGTSSAGGAVSLLTPDFATITTGNSRSISDSGVPFARYAGHGILLQSVGGGGGDGGIGLQGDVSPTGSNYGLDVGIGGSAKGGGAGGDINIDSMSSQAIGTITTTDPGAWGVFAQSVGGGGGTGGTGIDGDVDNGQSKGLTFGLGNSGGGGGKGGDVLTSTEFKITTYGDGSKGLVAQSIGGGGGAGGTGINGNISGGDDDDDTKQVSFGLGLSGGGGGDGGSVQLISAGTDAIMTGTKAVGGSAAIGAGLISSDAIFAQSVGGGGGAGGMGVNGNISNSSKANAMSLNLGIGSGGGGGGDGGSIVIFNNAPLSATGPNSRGIFAQAVGAGGGAGGLGLNGNISAPSDAESDKQIDVGIGGKGGSAGNGGQIFVNNFGVISTQAGSSDDAQGQMHGILAQSVGGGGGDGAIGIKGNVTGSKSSKALNVALGGGGGSGGDGAQGQIVKDDVSEAGVGIENAGVISVSGDGSVGIFAQNIGGGGGNGAVGLGGTVDSGGGKAVTFALGAAGGSGGDGGTVNIDNEKQITAGSSGSSSDPANSQSHGILAQSIGGGGGTGSLTGSLLYGSTSSGTEKGIAFTVGGTATGGEGGQVLVTDAGAITTYAGASHGIFAQSVGGGGGLAGDLGGIGTKSASNTWDAAIGIGGGGGSGSGQSVSVAATGSTYETYGNGSFAIFAQSIGGGGGSGGNAAGLSDTGDDTQTTKNAKLAINVGGQNSSSGDGGDVSVTAGSGASLATTGESSVVVMAQSIGGGGGLGGAGASGLSGTVTVGGSGSVTGDGGTVTVSSAGDIASSGKSAHGIFAQSVGGGGGYGGSFLAEEASIGTGLDMSLGTTTSGSGNSVDVTVSGSVSTTGQSAFGVFAQSVGGGGGVAGSAGSTETAAMIGSSGGTGDAGAVSVMVSDNSGNSVSTTGAFSHGVFAQSVGGDGTDTTTDTMVEVVANADVSATGIGAYGIFAQSGGDGRGVISVEVGTDATIEGGQTGEDGSGIGIFVKNGTSNTVENAGIITTAVGVDGVALQYSGTGSLKVTNTGVIIGSQNLGGSGTFSVSNQQAGVLVAGSTLDVNLIENAGYVQIGEAGDTSVTTLSGDYTQSDSGSLAFDIDPAQGFADQFAIGGSADLGGNIVVSISSVPESSLGAQEVSLLQADEGVSQSDLGLRSSAVAQYSLDSSTSDEVVLSYNIDFANDDIKSQTNDSQDRLVEHLQRLLESGVLANSVPEETLQLLEVETSAEFAVAAESLSGEVYANTQLSTLVSSQRFGESLLSCAEREGALRFVTQDQCYWSYAGGGYLDVDSTKINVGFNQDSYLLSGGAQFAIAPDTFLGFGLSYEHTSLGMGYADAKGDQFQIGGVVKRQIGRAMLSASISGGYGSFDVTRNPVTGGRTKGTQDIWNLSGRARGAYTFEKNNWYITPRIDLGVDHVSAKGLTETGSSALTLKVEGSDNTYVWLQPAVEFGGEMTLQNGMLLRPSFTAGLTQFIGNDGPSSHSAFSISPPSDTGYLSEAQFDRTYVDLVAGVEVFLSETMSLSASGFARVSENTETYGGFVKLDVRF